MQKYAGFLTRFISGFVDLMVVILVFYLLSIILNIMWIVERLLELLSINGIMNLSYHEITEYGMFILLGIISLGIYYTLMESSYLQGSLGKIALNLKVCDLNGKKISFGRALLRFLGKVLSLIPGIIISMILILLLYKKIPDLALEFLCVISFITGFLPIIFNEKKRGIEDFTAGTLVVKEKECKYIVTACVFFVLFFLLAFFPVVNLVLLGLAIFYSIKQIVMARKEPRTYGGKIFSIICLMVFLFSLGYSLYVLFLFFTGKISV